MDYPTNELEQALLELDIALANYQKTIGTVVSLLSKKLNSIEQTVYDISTK